MMIYKCAMYHLCCHKECRFMTGTQAELDPSEILPCEITNPPIVNSWQNTSNNDLYFPEQEEMEVM